MESVAVWRPFEPQTSLPPIGTRESTQLDFKAKPTTDRFEAAKDVECLANADGGSLLIGAAGGDHLDSYKPLSTDEAREAQRVFDEAVRDRCAPAPLISFAQIGLGDGIVLAVNVWPFPGQLVGVRLKR